MKTRHLEAEFAAAVGQVGQPHLDLLRKLSVQPSTIARLNLAYPSFGVMTGEIVTGGVFVPGDGAMHMVQPVVEHEQLVDYVAWRSSDPQRWGLRTGLGWLLNADSCLSSRWDTERLILHPTPLDWLRAGAISGVVLDWDAPDLLTLRGFDRIDCSNDMLAGTLRRALTKPVRVPKIRAAEVRYVA